jgi:hypothetical protein
MCWRISSAFHKTKERLPSGKRSTLANQVHWARSYLAQAGLVEATRRAHFKITRICDASCFVCLGERGQSAGESRDTESADMVGQVTGDGVRGRRNGTAPSLEMGKVGQVSSPSVLGEALTDQIPNGFGQLGGEINCKPLRRGETGNRRS